MFLYWERAIAHHIDQQRAALSVLCSDRLRAMAAGGADDAVGHPGGSWVADGFFFATTVADGRSPDDRTASPTDLESAVYATLESGRSITRKIKGRTGNWLSTQQSVVVTCPITVQGQLVAAAGMESSLAGVHHDLNRIQKIAFVFVLINSFFFALLGNRQLSRIYFKPLQRLARRAESYQDDDPLYFAVRKEDNEFSVLSSSLNKMLNRIANDRRALKETIGSLQTANRELKQAQNDIIRAEKLATVGRLTSGIAHEIGNPIGIVLGYLDLMRQADLQPAERADFIDRSEKEITRIHHIIRQLLDMSRASPGESKPVAVHELIHDLIAVLNFQPSAEGIVFKTVFNAADDRVLADPDRLRQVFLNILLNAVDALNISSNGPPCIELITGGPDGENDERRPREAPTIIVRIKDNGPGIRDDHAAHVFDPFFTTKQPGKGTGLGLSVSFMIIEKLGGHLSVSSAENRGTTFKVVLPLAHSTPHPGNATTAG